MQVWWKMVLGIGSECENVFSVIICTLLFLPHIPKYYRLEWFI